jgi:hypothetical protein
MNPKELSDFINSSNEASAKAMQDNTNKMLLVANRELSAMLQEIVDTWDKPNKSGAWLDIIEKARKLL